MTAAATLKANLRRRVPVLGAWTSFGHPSITEIFARAGVDFIGIDLEHSTISLAEAQRIIAAAQAGGVVCLPRVASHNAQQIQRLLDAGADGVIVPNVSTRAQVERLVEWCKYPPVGARSYGVARAHGYGMDFDRYVATWNAQSVLIIQVESLQAVEAAEEFVAHEALDGVMVGPYDISGSMGIPGRLDHPRVTAACARVIEACRRHGKACGTHLIEPDEARVRAAFASGYTFVVLASDVFVLWEWAERMRRLSASLRPPRRVGRHGRRVRVA